MQVSRRTVEGWVRRGHLAPCNRGEDGSRPKVARYRPEDVVRVHWERTSESWRRRLDELREQWERGAS